MEITFKGPAIVNLAHSDLINAFRKHAGDDVLLEAIKTIKSKDLTKIITDYLKAKEGMQVLRVQKYKDLEKVVAEVKYDQGARLISKEPVVEEKASNEGFKRRFTGFYEAVRVILDEYKAKKKNSITFDDLYKELLDYDGEDGKKRFIQGGIPIERWRMKQYMTKSQMDRQPNMKGVKRYPDGTGLSF